MGSDGTAMGLGRRAVRPGCTAAGGVEGEDCAREMVGGEVFSVNGRDSGARRLRSVKG